MEHDELSAIERESLEHCALFADVTRPTLEQCLQDSRCTRLSVPRGTEIYTPHVFHRSLGVLLLGRIRVWKEHLLVSELEQGALFGAAALFLEGEDYATTLAAQTPCTLLLFPESLVEELLSRSPQAVRNYVRYLSGRIRFLSTRLDGLLAGSSERKLAQYLLERMEGGQVRLEGSMTALAQQLHVSRASLYRGFETLIALGTVQKAGKLVYILDRTQLLGV